ncbi:hypothetical protein ACSVDA_09545 [Cytobacillus sp. Hm23]
MLHEEHISNLTNRYYYQPVRVMGFGGWSYDGVIEGRTGTGLFVRGRGGRRFFPFRAVATIFLLSALFRRRRF